MGNNRYHPGFDAPEGFASYPGYPGYPGHHPQELLPERGYAPQRSHVTGHPEHSAAGWPQPGYGPSAHDPYARHSAPSRPERDAPPVALGNITHALGAVLSVALIVGAGGWMWQMMQRDVAGVPVVRALEGPVRVAPDDPGGRQAAHQGLSVNGLAAASEDTPREQIVLAPAPLDLSSDALLSPPPPTEETPQRDETQPIPAALTQELPAEADRSEPAPALGMNNPTRRAVSESRRPPPRGERVAAAPPPSGASASGSANDAGDDLTATLADTVAASLSGSRDIDVDPATLGPGTRLVQLGAYDDVEEARAAWDQLARRFSPLLDDRGRVIEAAHSGGSVFYRLRAHGFADERDSRRFCAALVDQQIDCIPVLIR